MKFFRENPKNERTKLKSAEQGIDQTAELVIDRRFVLITSGGVAHRLET
jgi:hypothetical protein